MPDYQSASFYNTRFPSSNAYTVPDYQSASMLKQQFPISDAYTEFNSYYTEKRFWRKPALTCTYDEEDKPFLGAIPTSAPDPSQTVRYNISN